MKFKGQKKPHIKALIEEALLILLKVGIPLDALSDRARERIAMAFLAVAQIRNNFSEAISIESGRVMKTRDIIEFENSNYGENISLGSYDDIRRKDLKLLVEAGLVLNSSSQKVQATNNPNRGYALSKDFATLLHKYRSSDWDSALSFFVSHHNSLKDELKRKRELTQIPILLPSGKELSFSSGAHNQLQKSIIEEFLPRFGFGAEVLYVGDTSNKFLFRNDEKLANIHFFAINHEELPDIVALSSERQLLFLIEAVHSSGPMNELRVRRLKQLLMDCPLEKLFFTAFLTKADFRKWSADIAWETEVWIADNPDHLVHFNGYKFLEIHK